MEPLQQLFGARTRGLEEDAPLRVGDVLDVDVDAVRG
jgi:hypothetical protein